MLRASRAIAFLATSAVALTAWAGLSYLNVSQSKLRDDTHILVDGVGQGIALSGFELNFQAAGDHTLQSFAVMPDADRIKLSFRDKDGGELFQYTGNYVRIPTKPPQTARLQGCYRLSCDVPIAKPAAGEQFVLLGFSMKRTPGDGNIREIGVRPDPANGRVAVVFRDNGNNALGQQTNMTKNFDIEVRYAYAAGNLFAGQGTLTTRRTNGAPRGSVKSPNHTGRAVLQGFSLRFDNGDHHIHDVGIRNTGSAAAPVEFDIVFNDQNTDDPWTALVDYAALKG
jgi:hypothetical protein